MENQWIRFFRIMKTKFWAMIKINLLEVIGNLPALLAAMSMILGGNNLTVRFFGGYLLTCLQLVCIGPVQAGFIYTLRNYAREEHVFVLYDFIKGIRENWKQGLLVSLIDFILISLMLYTLRFYILTAPAFGVMGELCMGLIVILILLYTMMHLYIYPMMITLELTAKQLYGNALRLAAARFLPNLGILVVIFAFNRLIFVHMLTGAAGILLIGYSLPGFLSTFYAYKGIEHYILKRRDEI